jgi:hypothetical protein
MQQRSWPSERTTNNRSTKMLTAVVVDSQMANCNRFGYQQAIPHSPFIASTSEVLGSCRPEGKKKPSSGLVSLSQVSTSLSRQMHQWLGSRKTSHPYTKGILDKNYVSRSTLQGLLKYESTRLLVQSFLPYGRKKGLFGHIVAKSHKAWQTMELYPTWISEVHQTYPGHRISIWACRECLGHPISKKNKVKRLFFEWFIPEISFWLQIDYDGLHYK